MFVALDSIRQRCNAWDAIRGEAYACPECHEDVIVKRGATEGLAVAVKALARDRWRRLRAAKA
jgi:competence CoiA-like predicted nuclease